VYPGQLRGSLVECLHGDGDPRGYAAAEVFSVGRDHVEGRRCTEVHQDRRTHAVIGLGRIDYAVRADLLGAEELDGRASPKQGQEIWFAILINDAKAPASALRSIQDKMIMAMMGEWAP